MNLCWGTQQLKLTLLLMMGKVVSKYVRQESNKEHENRGEFWRGTKEQGPPNRRDPVISIYSAIACH